MLSFSGFYLVDHQYEQHNQTELIINQHHQFYHVCILLEERYQLRNHLNLKFRNFQFQDTTTNHIEDKVYKSL